MATSNAKSVAEYLKELSKDRRDVIAAVRKVILRNLPKGYEEKMNWGMIVYELPLKRYANTYNGQPLCYLALAAQKNYYAIYMMGVYSDKEQERSLRAEYRKAGKKLDMGRSCLRFRKVEDLLLDVIGKTIASTPPAKMIARYVEARQK